MSSESHVTFSLASVKTRFESGEPIWIQLRLHNKGHIPVWVNKRFLVNSKHSPAKFREIAFSVFDSAQQELDFACKVRAGEARQEDYTVLGPGEAAEGKYALSRCFDLGRPGQYSVLATFEDCGTTAPPDEIVHFTGPVTTQPLTLSVK